LPPPAAARLSLRCGVEESAADSQRETYAMDEGRVSLRELAEEELLLALPIVALHAPQTCGPGATYETGGETEEMSGDRFRPFSAFAGLLKKIDRT